MEQAKSQSIFAAWISLISNVLLTILKVAVGFLFNSQVLIADGIHNAGDVIASAAALGSMRISSRPPDEDHPYGHGKAEVIGASVVATILLLAALYVGYHSIVALFAPIPQAHIVALIAAALSLIWKLALYVYTIGIGRRANSKGLIATAQDHLADVYASGAAVIGIGLGLLGEMIGVPALAYGDPVAGIIVAVLVLKLAADMARESIDILMEKAIGGEEIKSLENIVRGVEEVKRIDRMRAREHGQYILIDLRVGIDAGLTIQQGHDVIRKIKKAIIAKHPNVSEVMIHLNPWYPGVPAAAVPEAPVRIEGAELPKD
ncbi:cation diffusion facilitator family transporter [Saccharibacillus sp. CPCC 101409]|uniref:cation diffusion facilitator family transporter n=1 Tax=Saccharibacillus sp. CPCC 101409 TaxID=3058041 RepID=UPI002673BF5E|nr:cation diffusion facilitator family transporter [Saccharibacillus sp. CPCC 101409]MDO3411167.1 cation diffusion facilitator family transporter [Saccharibacillus sp. CPCC 101409]